MSKRVTCYGEVLWDVFGDQKKIGGAPLNVALRLHSFGIHTLLISKIGDDLLGKNILDYLNQSHISPTTIQHDPEFHTGVVQVTLDQKGSASYEIKYPVAWDKIEITPEAQEAVKDADVFIFGSLVCRDAVSRSTLFQLLDHARFKVFDVNLRPPHYSMDVLVQLMNHANLIKCNEEELTEICNYFGENSSKIKTAVAFLSNKTRTDMICVTLGDKGAALYIDGKFYHHSGYPVEVVDTVGAGDSFLGSLVAKLLIDEWEPEDALSFACAVGALVASRKGANPKLTPAEIDKMMENTKA